MADQTQARLAEPFKGPFTVLSISAVDRTVLSYRVIDAERLTVSNRLTQQQAQWICDRLNASPAPAARAALDMLEEYGSMPWREFAEKYPDFADAQKALARKRGCSLRHAGTAVIRHRIEAALTTQRPAPEGWVLVPSEPTEAMLEAMDAAYMPFGEMLAAYDAMIAASTTPPVPAAEAWLTEIIDKLLVDLAELPNRTSPTPDELRAMLLDRLSPPTSGGK